MLHELTILEIENAVLRMKAKEGIRFDIDQYHIYVLDIVESIEHEKKEKTLYITSASVDGVMKYKEMIKLDKVRIFIGKLGKQKIIAVADKNDITKIK